MSDLADVALENVGSFWNCPQMFKRIQDENIQVPLAPEDMARKLKEAAVVVIESEPLALAILHEARLEIWQSFHQQLQHVGICADQRVKISATHLGSNGCEVEILSCTIGETGHRLVRTYEFQQLARIGPVML
jgi:hypothetical protein